MEDGIEDTLKNDDVSMAGSSRYSTLFPDMFFFVVHKLIILLSHPVFKNIYVKNKKNIIRSTIF